MNRRDFVITTALTAAGLAISEHAAAQPQPAKMTTKSTTFFEWKGVAPNVKVALGQGGNSTLIAGKDATYLIDTKNSPWGRTLRRESGAPGKLVVINTHHHADHTGGNHAFTKDCEVLAHEKCLPRIHGNVARYTSQIKEAVGAFPKGEGEALEKAREDWKAVYAAVTELQPRDFTPTRGLPDAHDITTGAKISARHFGPGHTDNDLVLHLPDANVLVMGDLIFRRLFPYVDPDGGGSIEGWITSLKKAQELCDAETIIIPGHGEVCGPEGLADQIAYFEKSRDAVAAALKAGRSRKDIVEMKVAFPGYANEARQSMTMIALYNELRDKK